MAKAENMVKYVEEHPFGQECISETSEAWEFYLKVINSLSTCQLEKWKCGLFELEYDQLTQTNYFFIVVY